MTSECEAIDSFRNLLSSLLARGDVSSTEQLQSKLHEIYGTLFPDLAESLVQQRMAWAKRYGWLPWEVAKN